MSESATGLTGLEAVAGSVLMPGRLGASLAIVGLSIGTAVLYGVVHDQITARVCVEYFTIGHPPVFRTTSPTLLGLGWGVIATWWVGLLLGLPMAFAAQVGSRPRATARSLVRPVALLLLGMGVCASLAGVTGYAAAQAGAVQLVEPLASRVPAERHSVFLADLWAHVASYGVGFLGGLFLVAWTWRRRALPAGAPGFHPVSAVQLSLVVVRTRDLEAARAFYEAIGLRFQIEQHGRGPEHLAAVQAEQVFELYPATEEQPVSSLRLGFRVQSVDQAVRAVRAIGGEIAQEPRPVDNEWRATLVDPDGRKVELSGG